MELRHLRYFLAVAQEANFTRAAEKLGIGQPPLSQQIKDLEEELGVALFLRTPRGAELTDAGRAFLTQAQQVLGGAEFAKVVAQRAARGETGQLRVGLTGSAGFNPVVPTMIRNYRRAYPHVHLSLEESNSGPMLEALRNDRLDAIFIRPGRENLEDLRVHRFSDEPMKIVLPASHRLAKKKRLAIAALADESFVLFPRNVGLYDEVTSTCRACGFEPRVTQEAPQISLIVNLVAAELGVSIVPAAMSQVRLEGLTYLDIEGRAPSAALALATRASERATTVANFIDLADG